MAYTFFNATKCDRCGGKIAVRTTSWFTEETICMECSQKEQVIKDKLRKMGERDAREGCGYVPDLVGA